MKCSWLSGCILLEFVIDIAISVFLNEKGQVYFCCVCISAKSINVSKEERSTVLFDSYSLVGKLFACLKVIRL